MSRRGYIGALASLLSMGHGCADSGFALLVEVRTDLVAGVEFDGVEIATFRDPPAAGASEPLWRVQHVADAAQSYVDPVRVAELTGVPPGEYFVRGRILRTTGVIAERVVTVEVRTNAAVTIGITRACASVSCPGETDTANAISCVGGSCVTPPCVTGREPECPPRECTADTDCAATDGCSTGTCIDGSCFARADDSRCAAAERCVPGRGCVDPSTCVPFDETCNGIDDDCDDRIDEGFDLTNDVAHCGECRLRCGRANGTASCVSGACTLTCDPGFADCNGEGADGCEADLSSATSCGSCGATCTEPTPLCEAAECVGGCGAGGAECGASCVDLTTDPSNCGACGTVCALAQATSVCTASACRVASCNAGFGNCDASDGNGCETSLTASLVHCGVCGAACSLGNATEECVAGTCGIISCDPGFDDCDGNPSNGCEASLRTLTHCGSCGARCALYRATETCASGVCQVASCEPDWGNCNGSALDGCETDVTNGDESHCGGCGLDCPGDERCIVDTCTCGADVGTPRTGGVCGFGERCCLLDQCLPTSMSCM